MHQGIFKEILELHKKGDLRDDWSPAARSRGGAPVGRLGEEVPPEAETHCRLL